jgi:hypothetical protein
MIFTCYFDESGTHGGSPVSAMGGFIADARQWRKYGKRTSRLFQRYGVTRYHAIDVRRGHGAFKGWRVDRKVEFVDEFQHILNETLPTGLVVFIRDDDYRYYRGLQWPKKARPDSKYTLMMRACLAHTIGSVGHLASAIEPRLHVVLEAGHKNAEDAVRSYEWAKSKIGPTHRALSGLTFATKDECLPLAAADHLSYFAWGDKVGQKPLGDAKGRPLKSEASFRHQIGFLDMDRSHLEGLYDQAVMIASGVDWRAASFVGQRP